MSQNARTGSGHSWSRRAILATGAAGGAGAVTGVAGCSGTGSADSGKKLKKKIENPPDDLNKTGFPIVDKPIKLHFMTGRWHENAKDYNKVANWKYYQKKTNIEIDWGTVPFDDREEKRNLALNGDDYPEMFYIMDFGNRDLGKYGGQGVFVNLKDLIDDYMPNLKKLMDEEKEVAGGMTFPDGGIYGLPYVVDPDFTALRSNVKLFVRQDWLDKFDMEVPSSTAEYHRYLKAVKDKKPNGKSDTIPYCDEHELGLMYSALMGSFGVGNRGSTQSFLDAEPGDDDKVRCYPISEGYKALMEYLHKLYSEGLIAKNVFSIDPSKVQAAAAKGTYGSMLDFAPVAHYGAKNFTPVPALKGPDGDHTYNLVTSSLVGVWGAVMTDNCKHPVAAARWLDYFYSDAGTTLYHMGVEGKSYKKTKDGPEYIDEIKDPRNGVTTDEAKKPYVTYMGGGYSGIVKQDYFRGLESSPQSLKAAKLLEPDIQKKVWPNFTYTQEEQDTLNSVGTDIEKYVGESRDKFISGDLKLSDWKKYVEKIKKMGLEDYMKVQQAAYDRYRKA